MSNTSRRWVRIDTPPFWKEEDAYPWWCEPISSAQMPGFLIALAGFSLAVFAMGFSLGSWVNR